MGNFTSMSEPKVVYTAGDRQLDFLSITTLALAIFVLLALVIEMVVKLPPETVTLLNYIDNGVCMFFIGEFFYRLWTSKNKLQYLKWGWIDLISSIPNIEILRFGRFVRVVRVIRIMRAVRSSKKVFSILMENRSGGTLSTVILATILLILFSSIAILNLETTPDSNITNAGDALWWSFVTITTVGYGDFYPVTLGGRIIASILMIGGIGLFGTFTAFVADWFFKGKSNE